MALIDRSKYERVAGFIEKMTIAPARIDTYVLKEEGPFPNNRLLPVVVYKRTLRKASLNAEALKQLFNSNNWGNSWVNGIFDYHHYHSNSHEVLGILDGHCQVQLGGDKGGQWILEQGDVLILPAGVTHRNNGCSPDFSCLGAYPADATYDMNYGKPGERPGTDERIGKVPIPDKDPVFGVYGPLFQYWK